MLLKGSTEFKLIGHTDCFSHSGWPGTKEAASGFFGPLKTAIEEPVLNDKSL